MKSAMARGIIVKEMIPKMVPVTVRVEKTDDFATLSLSDDSTCMIQVVVTPEVEKVLKSII